MELRQLTMEDLHWRPIGAKVRTRDGAVRIVRRKIFCHYEDVDGTFYDKCTLVYLLDDGSILAPDFRYEVLSIGTRSTCQPRRCQACQLEFDQQGMLMLEEDR